VSAQGGTRVIIIKKKAKHAAHHGGAWKVAYADFVTAMMALFIVLWLLTQSDEASKERLAQYFRTGMLPGGTLTLGTPAGSSPPVAINIFPSGSMGGPSPERQLAHDIDTIIDNMKTDPDMAPLASHVIVKIVNEGTLIELIDGGDNFVFPSGSSGLKPGAVEFLKKLAPLLSRLRNKIEIHGHTDARPFDNGKKTNWELSFDRANEARRVLEAAGVPSGKINGVLAHADSSPFNKEDPFAPENRRLALLVLRDKSVARKPVLPGQAPRNSAPHALSAADRVMPPGPPALSAPPAPSALDAPPAPPPLSAPLAPPPPPALSTPLAPPAPPAPSKGP
jgi:chemotaxis protein MotB